MDVIIRMNDEEELIDVKCPYCNSFSDLQYEDYIEYPMIWCDTCGVRCILNTKKYDDMYDMYDSNLTLYNLYKQYFNLYYEKIKYDDMNDTDNMIYYIKVDLMKIIGIKDPTLSDYIALEVMPVEDVFTFVNSGYSDIKLITKYKITKLNTEEDGFDYIIKYRNISYIPCDTYDVFDNATLIPKNFRYCHDGVYFKVKCINNKGDIIYTKFWGD